VVFLRTIDFYMVQRPFSFSVIHYRIQAVCRVLLAHGEGPKADGKLFVVGRSWKKSTRQTLRFPIVIAANYS
jgi:hypothetical protein